LSVEWQNCVTACAKIVARYADLELRPVIAKSPRHALAVQLAGEHVERLAFHPTRIADTSLEEFSPVSTGRREAWIRRWLINHLSVRDVSVGADPACSDRHYAGFGVQDAV
jgi:hypothetical protein